MPSYTPKLVPGVGPIGAPLILIGESPGRDEIAASTPFVGPAGKLLNSWLSHAVLPRSTIRIENVCQAFPRGGSLTKLTADEKLFWQEDLWIRLQKQYGEKLPNLILAVGAFSLETLTGLTGITAYRGSLLTPSLDHLKKFSLPASWQFVKILPVLHPAYVLRGNSGYTTACLRDFSLAASEVTHSHLKLPSRTALLDPTQTEATRWASEIKENPGLPISIDLETIPSERQIETIAIAKSPSSVLSAPWTPFIAKLTAELCALPNPKIMHNGLYDLFWLRANDCDVQNYLYDTRYMHHVHDPRSLASVVGIDGHSLDYLQSLYTREPFHKTMVKDLGKRSIGAYLQTKLQYGALDAAVTYEIYEALCAEMSDSTFELYRSVTSQLLPILNHLMENGIGVSPLHAQASHLACTIRCDLIREKFQALAIDLFGPQGISYKKLATFLYAKDALALTPIDKARATGKRSLSTDEVAILRHRENVAEDAMHKGWLVKNLLTDILTFKKQSKQKDFFSPDRIDNTPRGSRSFCSYSPVTEEGRLNSSRGPYANGTNHQNQPSSAKHIYIPDVFSVNNEPQPGIFLEVDLSQAESRVVYMLSQDTALIDLARIPPHEKDMHRHYAAIIFTKPEADITKEERQMGKKAVHASQRGMRGKTLSDALVKETQTFRSPKQCQQMIDNYLEAHPGLYRYFSAIQQQVIRHRTLTNTFNFTWQCPYDTLDDTLYRAAYSFLPQSSVAFLLYTHGLIPLWKWRGTFPSSSPPLFNLNATVHDSILLSCLPENAYRIASFLQQTFSRPIDYARDGNTLSMPCEFTLGTTWKGNLEYKQLPPEKEFTEAAFSLLP